jgi:hypothetical protein
MKTKHAYKYIIFKLADTKTVVLEKGHTLKLVDTHHSLIHHSLTHAKLVETNWLMNFYSCSSNCHIWTICCRFTKRLSLGCSWLWLQNENRSNPQQTRFCYLVAIFYFSAVFVWLISWMYVSDWSIDTLWYCCIGLQTMRHADLKCLMQLGPTLFSSFFFLSSLFLFHSIFWLCVFSLSC